MRTIPPYSLMSGTVRSLRRGILASNLVNAHTRLTFVSRTGLLTEFDGQNTEDVLWLVWVMSKQGESGRYRELLTRIL
jgi:hypothetical protein